MNPGSISASAEAVNSWYRDRAGGSALSGSPGAAASPALTARTLTLGSTHTRLPSGTCGLPQLTWRIETMACGWLLDCKHLRRRRGRGSHVPVREVREAAPPLRRDSGVRLPSGAPARSVSNRWRKKAGPERGCHARSIGTGQTADEPSDLRATLTVTKVGAEPSRPRRTRILVRIRLLKCDTTSRKMIGLITMARGSNESGGFD